MKGIFPGAMVVGASPPTALDQTNHVFPLFLLIKIEAITIEAINQAVFTSSAYSRLIPDAMELHGSSLPSSETLSL